MKENDVSRVEYWNIILLKCDRKLTLAMFLFQPCIQVLIHFASNMNNENKKKKTQYVNNIDKL